jgi:YHS domain-containing protein
MFKKGVLSFLLILVFTLSQVSFALAGTPPAETKSGDPKAKGEAKAPAVHEKVANEVAVCACGMVFVPHPGTKYIEYEGKKYAMCSDPCREMGMKDPAKMAKMAEANMHKLMAMPPPMPAGKK